MDHALFLQIDRIAVVAYFFTILVIGLSASRDADGDTLRYFLSGRKLGWTSIGVSLLAADVLCGHLMGVRGPFAGALAIDLELVGIVGLVFLGWRASNLSSLLSSFTTNDSLDRVYGGKVGTYVSLLFIATYLLVRLSLVLLLGAFLVRFFSNWDASAAIAAAVLISGVYSIAGGFSAVVSTQVVQAVFMFLGFGAFVAGLLAGPALSHAVSSGVPAMAGSAGVNASPFPWLAIAVGVPVVALWLWLTDQYVLQHVFSARSEKDLKKGVALVAVAKGLVIAGLLAVFVDVPGSYSGKISLSLPLFLKGVVLIGILSAIMSSLSGLFNSTSAMFTMDIYRRRKPESGERKLVLVGRLSTTAVVLISLLWMPLLGMIGWQGSGPLQSLLACFAAVVVAVFMTGLLWKRATSVAAIIAVIVGITTGAFRVVFDEVAGSSRIGSGIIVWLLKTQYLNFAAIDFFICLAVIVLASLFLPSRSAFGVLQEARKD